MLVIALLAILAVGGLAIRVAMTVTGDTTSPATPIGSRVRGQTSITCLGLGQFDNMPPFDLMPLPHCPEDLGNDLIFSYFTQDNQLISQDVEGTDRTTIVRDWLPTRQTVFVIHGWTNDVDTDWLNDFKNAHLDLYDMNVVNVGWGGPYGAGDLNYQKSASTTRTIGAHLAEVIENLIVVGGASEDSFHLIGHSLGAHVAGHAGRWASSNYGRNLGRITGMDPAGPEFVTVTDRTIGLYFDCAALVDTINTDNVYGSTPTNLGHQNYYPNGGIVQPGCEQAENTCAHIRAIYLYQESLDQSTCIFAARDSCEDSADLPASCSPCAGVCGAMGYPATAYTSGIYYVTTNGFVPYCQG